MYPALFQILVRHDAIGVKIYIACVYPSNWRQDENFVTLSMIVFVKSRIKS